MQVKELETIASEVKSSILATTGSLDGQCVSAVRMVVKKLEERGIRDIKQARFNIDDGSRSVEHTVIFLGRIFEDSYRIDPTMPQFGPDQMVFRPGEEYPLELTHIEIDYL